MNKNCKTNQSLEFKSDKKKDDKLYVKLKGYDNSLDSSIKSNDATQV